MAHLLFEFELSCFLGERADCSVEADQAQAGLEWRQTVQRLVTSDQPVFRKIPDVGQRPISELRDAGVSLRLLLFTFGAFPLLGFLAPSLERSSEFADAWQAKERQARPRRKSNVGPDARNVLACRLPFGLAAVNRVGGRNGTAQKLGVDLHFKRERGSFFFRQTARRQRS